MGFPKVSIIFRGIATSAIKRSQRGVVCLLLSDTNASVTEMASIADMPATLSDTNKKYVQDAFVGGTSVPRKVIVVTTTAADATANYVAALKVLETMTYDYLAVPGIASAATAMIVSFVKSQRETKKRTVKVVLPNTAADHEGVINFATDNIVVGANTYSASQYCARIAGILAGTPMTASTTFFSLPEVDNVPALTDDEKDAACDAGKLIIVNDGRKCKIAKGVNSLTTLSAEKPAVFKKIKIVDILDLIADDVRHTCEDNYIGKVINDYDNVCLLIAAINGYFEELALQGLLAKNQNSTEFDVAAKTAYLKGIGKYVDGMNDLAVKLAVSGDKVFLKCSITPLDVMEEINIVIGL